MCHFNMNEENSFIKSTVTADLITLSIKPFRLVCTSRVLFLFLFFINFIFFNTDFQ